MHNMKHATFLQLTLSVGLLGGLITLLFTDNIINLFIK